MQDWQKMLEDLKSNHSSQHSGDQMVTEDQWTMDGLLQLLQLSPDQEISSIVRFIPHIGQGPQSTNITGIDERTDQQRGTLWQRQNNWRQQLFSRFGYNLGEKNSPQAIKKLQRALTLYWSQLVDLQ